MTSPSSGDNARAQLHDTRSILFVCMGNICRSPTAEGFFRHHLAAVGLDADIEVDSAGTHGYHVGHAPDERAARAVREYGVDISGLRARRVAPEDLERFDLVVAMDEQNLSALSRLSAGSPAEIALMLDWGDGGEREVPDPYYGGPDGFRFMCELLDGATRALLDDLRSGR